jgi:hypothetical protein
MSQTTLKGSCLCGAVKYEVTGDPRTARRPLVFAEDEVADANDKGA